MGFCIKGICDTKSKSNSDLNLDQIVADLYKVLEISDDQ